MYDPTAVQAVAVVQETPERTLLLLPEGLGVDWIDQAVPFQRSTSAPPEDHPHCDTRTRGCTGDVLQDDIRRSRRDVDGLDRPAGSGPLLP